MATPAVASYTVGGALSECPKLEICTMPPALSIPHHDYRIYAVWEGEILGRFMCCYDAETFSVPNPVRFCLGKLIRNFLVQYFTTVDSLTRSLILRNIWPTHIRMVDGRTLFTFMTYAGPCIPFPVAPNCKQSSRLLLLSALPKVPAACDGCSCGSEPFITPFYVGGFHLSYIFSTRRRSF